jgi:ABC-type transport system involved in Fe-S cluster assembly fused permease/ATPase subunit
MVQLIGRLIAFGLEDLMLSVRVSTPVVCTSWSIYHCTICASCYWIFICFTIWCTIWWSIFTNSH